MLAELAKSSSSFAAVAPSLLPSLFLRSLPLSAAVLAPFSSSPLPALPPPSSARTPANLSFFCFLPFFLYYLLSSLACSFTSFFVPPQLYFLLLSLAQAGAECPAISSLPSPPLFYMLLSPCSLSSSRSFCLLLALIPSPIISSLRATCSGCARAAPCRSFCRPRRHHRQDKDARGRISGVRARGREGEIWSRERERERERESRMKLQGDGRRKKESEGPREKPAKKDIYKFEKKESEASERERSLCRDQVGL